MRIASVRRLFIEADGSLAERMRLRRWSTLLAEFPALAEMRVLDLGGTSEYWRRAPVRPQHVTVINLEAARDELPGITSIVGNACEADRLTSGQEFDLVHSNSLLEHLGGHQPRAEFARVVRRLAPAYWVQTPYRYFPIEPHWIFPGMQFLPIRTRGWIAPRWPLGHTRGWSTASAFEEVMNTDLVGESEMCAYFPDATIVWERFATLRKSVVAVRHERDGQPLHD